jgi:hypothetical protein
MERRVVFTIIAVVVPNLEQTAISNREQWHLGYPDPKPFTLLLFSQIKVIKSRATDDA